MLTTSWIAGALAAAALVLAPTQAPASEAAGGEVRVRLAPRMADAAVAAVDIQVALEAPQAQAGEVLIELPLVRAMAPSALQDSEALRASDDLGPLDLTVEAAPVDPTGFRQDRRWRVQRATVGDVVVRYAAVPREITPAVRPGPLYDMRGEGGGFHGSGAVMIALPPDAWPRPVRIDWDLSAMPDGARGASSLGEGPVRAVVLKQGVASSFFMAGPLNSLPWDGQGAFVGYWITPPAFDLHGALGRIEPAYRAFATFFGDEAAPFRVFMRTTPTFAGGGSGGYNSFMFGTVEGQVREEAEVLGLLAHETLHNWLNGLGEETSQWWSEGTTSYYTEVLSYRTGLSTLAQFQERMNALAHAYYTNPRSNLSTAEVTQLFFSDGDAQLVPYQRGPLYFAQVDARMRAASDGQARVDDLVVALLRARREGGDYSRAGWVALLRGALGEDGVAEFEAMTSGQPMDLPPNLLGVCFDREAADLRRFEPGFRVEHDGRVTRLLPDSHGARAGVREGDWLADPDALDAIEAAGPAETTVTFIRDGAPFQITFEPWGPARPGYRWVRNAVPEDACGI